MSRNQIQRLVRLNSLIPELQKKVDDKALPFNTAVELSYLAPEEQRNVLDYMIKEQTVPSLANAQELKARSQEAAKAAKAAKEEAEKAGTTKPNITPFIPPTAPNSTSAPPAPAAPPPPKKIPAPITGQTIASVMKPKREPDLKVTLSWEELRGYFSDKQPSVPEAKRAIFDAMDLRKKALERQAAKKGPEKPATR